MNAVQPASQFLSRDENARMGRSPQQLSHARLLSARVASLVLAGLVLTAAGLFSWYWLRAPAPTEYVTAPVARGSVVRTVTATGSVNPVLTITVGTYVSGVIQNIYCDFNTQVKKGQLCARIDPRPYQTVVDQDRASLATARAQLVKDQASLRYLRAARQRYVNLHAEKAASRDALEIAMSNAAQAEAQVRMDTAAIAERAAVLSAAEVNLGYTDIVSPVDGTVVARNVTVGQTVAASFQTPTLFLIATDLSAMQVDVNVSESDIGEVKVGDRAEFTVEAYADHVFAGRVAQVRQAPQTVQNVVTYDVVATVPNPDLLLKPGMTATVRIVTKERRGVLRVPNQALRYVPGGLAAGKTQTAPFQLWVLRDGRPQPVRVAVGLDDDTMTEIASGSVRAGDRVVISEKGQAAPPQNSGRPAIRF